VTNHVYQRDRVPTGQEVERFRDYSMGQNTETGLNVNPVFREEKTLESNTNTVDKETCPFYFNGFDCPHGEGCEHPHDDQDPMKVESIMYPLEHVVNINCVYPIYVLLNGEYKPLANSVVTSGGFLTTRHTFFALNGLRMTYSLDQFRVYDIQSKRYFKILGIFGGTPESVAARGGEWDFCKFTVEPELAMSSKENQVVCAPFLPEHGMCRMVQFSWQLKQPATFASHSMSRLINGAVLDYQGINTMPGDSGSPVFDMRGRLIALHKKGDPNQGLIFSPGGVLDSWFISQSAAKNFLSPRIPL